MRNIADYVTRGGNTDYQRFWEDVSNDLNVDRNTLICGYVRQPITIGAVGDTVIVKGTCSLEGRVCNHYVNKNDKFELDQCERYRTFFENYKEPKKKKNKRGDHNNFVR